MSGSLTTSKYRQGHRQSYHLKALMWFLIRNFNNCGRIIFIYSFWDIGRENDNLGWNDLQMSFKVIERGTNWKLVHEFLLVLYSDLLTFAVSCTVSELQAVLVLKTTFLLVFVHTCIWPWICRSHRRTMETKFGIRKLESWAIMWWRNRTRRSIHVGTVHECDSQTDGQTDRFTISKTALCIVSRRKNNDSVSYDNASQ